MTEADFQIHPEVAKGSKALQIAKTTLADCYIPKLGIVAGQSHFSDLWARDGGFAALGANKIGLEKETRDFVTTFLHYQRTDGLIPYRILRSPTTIEKYRGHPKLFETPQSNFRSHQSGGIVLDGGLILPIVFRDYIDTTSDTTFLQENYPKFKKALSYYEHRFGDGLLSEFFQSEWADAVLKSGKVLYTNVLYFKALQDMSHLAQVLGKSQEVKYFSKRAEQVSDLIHKEFWNGDYFYDWIDYKPQAYFASHQNLLAVWFGLTRPDEATSIIDFAQKNCMNDFTIETNYPRYPFWRIPVQNHLFGLADYQNRGCLWLQPGILYALSLDKIGDTKGAQEALKKISQKIETYDGVYEVYEKDGRPVNRKFYKAEPSFAWSAGLYALAHQKIFNSSNQ